MLTAVIELNEFNRRMNRLITDARLNPRKVMKRELGELVKTLVKVSPPRDLAKSKKSILPKVQKRFETLNKETNFNSVDVPVSKSGVKWWAASSKFLYGGAPDTDMRKASVQVLRGVYYKAKKIQGSGRVVVGFKRRKGSQKAAITTRVIIRKGQDKAVSRQIEKNFGRLKAGWLVPVNRGAVTLSGQFTPPGWVLKHKNGARGDFINGLNNEQNPNFTIINRAKGVSGEKSRFFVGLAMTIRAKAMKSNAETILSGKSEYKY